MDGFFGKMLRKLRGILGLGLIGGVVGFFGGGAIDLLGRLVNVGIPGDAALWGSVLRAALRAAFGWGMLGAFVGTGFGGLLALTNARRTLQELSGWQVGLLGAVAGALFFPAFIISSSGIERLWLFTPLDVLLNAGTFATLGVGLSWSMVALAKRADRAELAVVQEVEGLLEAEGAGDPAPPVTG